MFGALDPWGVYKIEKLRLFRVHSLAKLGALDFFRLRRSTGNTGGERELRNEARGFVKPLIDQRA